MEKLKHKRVKTLSFTTTKEVDDILSGIVKDIKAKGFMISKTDIINDALMFYLILSKDCATTKSNKKVDNKKVN